MIFSMHEEGWLSSIDIFTTVGVSTLMFLRKHDGTQCF